MNYENNLAKQRKKNVESKYAIRNIYFFLKFHIFDKSSQNDGLYLATYKDDIRC